MIITKTYKYKVYQSKKNKKLHQQINISGIIYNKAISLHKRYYRRYKTHLNVYQLMAHLAKLRKRSKYMFWNLVGSQAIQDICQRIEKAYKLFFRNLKHGIKTAPPGFKKVKKYKSFTLKQSGWTLLDENKIKIGSHVYKYAKSRGIEGVIKTVTIKRDALNDIYLLFTVKQEVTPSNTRGNNRVCGFDFGLKTFLVSSNGSDIKNPLFFKQSQKDIKTANRELSRKQKGSNHYKQAKRKLAKVHETVKNRRKDYQFKIANQLTDNYDVLIFETLNIKGMQRLWGKKVSDLGFSSFVNIISYYGVVKGNTVHFLDQWEPTTKPCSVCGYMNHTLTLKDRMWTCPNCFAEHDRDKNAAMNIERLGASSLGLGDVRPSFETAVSA